MDQQNASVATPSDPERRTQEIREEIDQTREDLSETVNAIQDRLRPSSIAASAAERVKEATVATARDVANSEPVSYVNENRLPMAMVGIGVIGLAWLVAGRGNGHPSRPASGARRRVGWWNSPGYRRADWQTGTPGYETDRALDIRAEPYARAEPYTGTEQYTRAERYTPEQPYAARVEPSAPRTYTAGRSGRYTRRSYVERTWDGNPLMVGAASAVLGILIGLGVPETEREHELMGETRDNMIGTVQDTVRSKAEQVQQAAANAVSTVQDAAKEAVGLSTEDQDATRDRVSSEPR
jgi:Protein of unknown function (DUF3618)